MLKADVEILCHISRIWGWGLLNIFIVSDQSTFVEGLPLRDLGLVKAIAEKIRKVNPGYPVRVCHVCGTHEYIVTHFGLRTMIPENIEIIAGPGCPVCVTPAREIDEVVKLALEGVTAFTFGDVLRVPGSKLSLSDAKAKGADVRVIYSIDDAIDVVNKERSREFVFFAVGFETTAPTNAFEISRGIPSNLTFMVSHRLIPPVMELLMGIGDIYIDGFICPGHVATIIGAKVFEIFPRTYGMPTVIAGFEPVDFMLAILMILKQIVKRDPRLENEYVRSVTYEGNLIAQDFMKEVFEVTSGDWRGIGRVPSSSYKIRDAFSKCDARARYDVTVGPSLDVSPGCQCHLVILGKIKPTSCPMFMKKCRPEQPLGPCMVSREGTCQIWAAYGNPKARL